MAARQRPSVQPSAPPADGVADGTCDELCDQRIFDDGEKGEKLVTRSTPEYHDTVFNTVACDEPGVIPIVTAVLVGVVHGLDRVSRPSFVICSGNKTFD